MEPSGRPSRRLPAGRFNPADALPVLASAVPSAAAMVWAVPGCGRRPGPFRCPRRTARASRRSLDDRLLPDQTSELRCTRRMTLSGTALDGLRRPSHVAPHETDRTRDRAQHPVNHHTHLQQVAGCLHVDTVRSVMDLERGMLARIDRKLLSGLGQSETYRMVRVPVTASKWSTWKRYCDSAGISMGRAIAAMIDRELVSVFGDSAGGPSPVFAEKAEEELARRQDQVARREFDDDGGRGTAPSVERASPQVGGRARCQRAARRAQRKYVCSISSGADQGRAQRAMPVRFGSQVQALPWPARPVAGRAPR